MKKILIVCTLLAFVSCKKKNVANTDPSSTTTGTSGLTTTGSPVVTGPPFAAELTVTNTDHNYSYAGAFFYDSGKDAVLINSLKCNGQTMGQYPANEYRYATSSSLYTVSVKWEISSSRTHIPDTTVFSPVFPALGFTTSTGRTYNSAQPFSIAVDVAACDSMFVTLGGIQKKLGGKSGITSVNFASTDGVKADSFDPSQVIVEINSVNYSVFTVRGKKWKLMSRNTAQSHYIYK